MAAPNDSRVPREERMSQSCVDGYGPFQGCISMDHIRQDNHRDGVSWGGGRRSRAFHVWELVQTVFVTMESTAIADLAQSPLVRREGRRLKALLKLHHVQELKSHHHLLKLNHHSSHQAKVMMSIILLADIIPPLLRSRIGPQY